MNKQQALEAIKKKIELESELEILMHELRLTGLVFPFVLIS